MNQVEAHPYFQQDELFEFCRSKGIHLTAYSPLGSPDRPEGMKAANEPSLLSNPVIVKIAEEKGINAEIIVKDGKPATEILKIARDKQVDLLVLGSTGKGSISKMMVGSISEKVASTAKCSVLVVKSSRIERVVPE